MTETAAQKPDWDIVRSSFERFWYDIGYAAAFELFDYRLDFKVYECQEATCSDGRAHPYYITDGDCNFGTEDRDRASVFLEGAVKWDGCTNYAFNNESMMHSCSREGLQSIGDLLVRVWDEGKNIPHWNGES